MTPTIGVIAGGGIPAAKAEAGVVPPGRKAPGLGVFMDPGVMGAPFLPPACALSGTAPVGEKMDAPPRTLTGVGRLPLSTFVGAATPPVLAVGATMTGEGCVAPGTGGSTAPGVGAGAALAEAFADFAACTCAVYQRFQDCR